ncbi:MAG TPA: universal stress protein [Bryobacteraceae bacterium]
MKIDHILFAVDFSAYSRSLNSEVEWLSSHFDSRVTLLHVFEIPTSWYGEGEIPLICSEDILAYSKSEKELLDDYAIQIPENRVQRISVEGGAAWHIADWVRNHDVDLVVIGTHGYGPFRRLMLGSVAMKVMHDASCPVWTHAMHSDGESRIAKIDRISNIVCAIDLTDEAVPLLRFTKELAAYLGANVRLVHTLTGPDWLYKYFDLEKVAGEEISKIQTEAGTDFAVSLTKTHIAQNMTEVAFEQRADLIVVGRGKTQATFGSLRTHAYEIIRRANCPVLSYSMDWHPHTSSASHQNKVPEPVA